MMQRTQLRLVVVTLVVSSLAWIGYRVADTMSRRRHDAVGDVLQILPDAAQRLQDFHRVKLENGRLEWELRAREAQYYEEEHRAVVQQPEMIFYSDGEERARLQGAEGRLVFDGTDLLTVELRGGVRVQGDGFVLETDLAAYDRDRDVITAPGPVHIDGRDLTVLGQQMEIAVSSQLLTLRRDVRVTVRPKDDEPES
jgi:LPS export ABC transporter protein LptC